MLTIFYASLLIALIVIPIPLLIIADKKSKKKALQNLLQQLNNVGLQNGLNYSGQEVFKNMVIGVDGLQRKLALVERLNENNYSTTVISLNNLLECSVKKQYRRLPDKNLPKGKGELLLESITLQITSANQLPIEVPFYNYLEDSIFAAQPAGQKALQWEMMLSKMQMPANNLSQ